MAKLEEYLINLPEEELTIRGKEAIKEAQENIREGTLTIIHI